MTEPASLHERITAKLNDLEVLARAVRNERFVLNAARQSGRTAFAAYLHDCGPEATLRGLAEDRSILRRHAPCDDCPGHTVRMACHRCDLPVYRRGYGELGCEWQLSVARRHGIEEA